MMKLSPGPNKKHKVNTSVLIKVFTVDQIINAFLNLKE